MEPNFQVPAERPSRVTRDYLLHLIRPAFGLPVDLLPAAADYLEAKGVIANSEAVGYHLPDDQDALLQVPEEAARAMHRAVLSHSRTPQCPAILKHIVLVMPSGGTGLLSQSGPRSVGNYSSLPSPTDKRAKDHEKVSWRRAHHIAELADFGAEAAVRVLDVILARLSAGAVSGPPTHTAPRTGQVAWAEVLARIEDAKVREDFRLVIERHRATGQPADHEILSALKAREDTERVAASLANVLGHPDSTAAEQCRRWTKLIDLGQSLYQKLQANGSQAIAFDDDALASGPHPDAPMSSPVRWATEVQAATKALHPLAVSAQFAPGDLRPLHALVRDLDSILRGEATDVRAAVEGVRLIVAEIEVRMGADRGNTAKEVAGPVLATSWAPSAHQLAVLSILKRDGRLRTRTLWERIVPRHVDLRAHQNAMRDLIDNGKVLSAGKGRATEYWLP